MRNGIHESLLPLAVDIEKLRLLDGNPRIGDVDAIVASYKEFGQVKPIVARKNEDGTATVIAGNHQLQAASALGWDKIAVVFLEADDKRAIAFAIADNRTVELGYTEPELLDGLLVEVADYYPELFDALGWDEFELAGIEYETERSGTDFSEAGVYVPPSVVQKNEEPAEQQVFHVSQSEGGENRIVADPSSDQRDVAVRGSSVTGATPRAVVQYTIVFDGTDQQTKWYDFIRWLKSDPGTDGATTAERLINFIEAHTEV
jgi:ParB-like chromosome segregation protein Spo0J